MMTAPPESFVDPERERYALFKDLPRGGAIHMLNLVRLKEWASYDDGRKVSGAEAYAAYARESEPVLQKLGGRIVWSGAFELTLIGPGDERWDVCFIAEYPSADALIAMLRDADYRLAVRHRQVGVQTSRLIRFRPRPPGSSFG